jgi:hypothetical protein
MVGDTYLSSTIFGCLDKQRHALAEREIIMGRASDTIAKTRVKDCSGVSSLTCGAMRLLQYTCHRVAPLDATHV